MATIYLKKKKAVTAKALRKAFEAAYEDEPFVRLKAEGVYPTLKDVQNTNYCDLGLFVDAKADRVIVIAAIDNLLKGASGQAIQNMNIRMGFPEEEGLA